MCCFFFLRLDCTIIANKWRSIEFMNTTTLGCFYNPISQFHPWPPSPTKQSSTANHRYPHLHILIQFPVFITIITSMLQSPPYFSISHFVKGSIFGGCWHTPETIIHVLTDPTRFHLHCMPMCCSKFVSLMGEFTSTSVGSGMGMGPIEETHIHTIRSLIMRKLSFSDPMIKEAVDTVSLRLHTRRIIRFDNVILPKTVR